jgi:hypothetical protein
VILNKHFGPSLAAEEGFPTFITPYSTASLASAKAWVESCVATLNEPQLVD